MKKFFCCLGLFFAGFMANFSLASLLLFLTFALFILFFPVAVFLDIVIIILAVIITILLMKNFRKLLNIGAPLFIVSAQLPTVVLSTVCFLILKSNSSLFSSHSFLGIEMEYALSLVTSISSTLILCLTIIICLTGYFIENRLRNKSKLQSNT